MPSSIHRPPGSERIRTTQVQLREDSGPHIVPREWPGSGEADRGV